MFFGEENPAGLCKFLIKALKTIVIPRRFQKDYSQNLIFKLKRKLKVKIIILMNCQQIIGNVVYGLLNILFVPQNRI